jgi:hypothetical protein
MEPNGCTSPQELQGYLQQNSSAVFIVRYGSHRPGSDIDLLTVVPDDQVVPLYRYPNGVLDPLVVGAREFRGRLALLDPLVTEPILTGTILHGSVVEYESCKHELAMVEATPDSVQYLYRSAQATIEATLDILDRDSPTRIELLTATSNATFALSYAQFALRYRNGARGPLSLAELCAFPDARGQALRNALLYKREVKRTLDPPELSRIFSLLFKAQEVIASLLALENNPVLG